MSFHHLRVLATETRAMEIGVYTEEGASRSYTRWGRGLQE